MRPLPRLAPLLAACAVLATACGSVVTLEAGDPVEFVQQPQTSRILASDGSVLAELHGEQDREDVPLEQVADVLTQAVVSVEDRRFFLHRGVDVAAIARAAVRNVEAGGVSEGGSTITQQYVKNTMTGNAVTLDRKLEEAALAFQLEQRYSKGEILERYLNTVYFGKGAYGVRAASQRFFGVAPDELALDQAALLAGLVQSPSTYDPYTAPERALARREVVLRTMVETGAITRAEADAAAAAPLELAPSPEEFDLLRAPYLVDEVKRILTDDPDGVFAAVLGADVDTRVEALFGGGLRITTTLDPEVQRHAEEAVASVLTEPDDPAAAVVVLDPDSGAVRAMVGGRDWFDPDDPTARFNLATRARRQPGSSFKPIVLATALDRGVGLDRMFPGGACVAFEEVPDWRDGVCNYADTAYGPVSLREATVASVNTAYARLSVELGPQNIAATARTLGITGLGDPVPAIALGAQEVTPLQLAGAYQPFATLGVQHPVHLVERIETADGRVLWEHRGAELRVLPEAVAYFVTATLTEVVERGTGVRADIDRPQAGKTGTSQNSADAWFVGYTPDLLAAVWVGFPEGQVPMVPPRTREVVEGGRWPAQIWAALMEPALDGVDPTPFPVPQIDLQVVEVDATRDCLPNPYTPADVIELREYLPGTAPTELCTEPTGPPVDDVPDVVGLPLDTARSLLAAQGFPIVERPIAATLYPPGFVARQRPGPGGSTSPDDGNAVVLWVTVTSRTRVAVPSVVGLPRAEAVAALEDAGFVVDVREGCDLQECVQPSGSVEALQPGAGERVVQHGVVTILVAP
ncbi:MAG: transglycosylase domain-containing protein [Actinomycetes bacterium]